MGLVSYDDSDEEEQIDKQEEKDSNETTKAENNEEEKDDKSDDNNSNFSIKLPPPKSYVKLNPSLSDIVLTKKQSKGPVKIAAPSIRNYEDEEDDEEETKKAKRFKPSSSGTFLTSLLPKPKNSTSLGMAKNLIPQSVARPKPNLPLPKKQPVKDNDKIINEERIIIDDADEKLSDYFSLTEKSNFEKMPKINDKDIIKHNVNVIQQFDIINNVKSVDIAPTFETPSSSSTTTSTSYYYSPEQQQPQSSQSNVPSLNDYTYKKLIASKFGEETPDEINIIDVDVSKHLSQSNEWLKTVSQEQDEQYQGAMPTSTARRKHQITYLAFQAKQREVELKNQWASNRMMKNQARAKYGF